MKRDENKLIELAFGELDAHEAEVLRRELAADAEAEKFVADFEALRLDMRQLDNDIPEHQLSTERLRHAILNQGLHEVPRKRASWLSWFWMPAAAASVTLALLTVLNRPTTPLVYGGGPDTVKSALNQIDSVALNETKKETFGSDLGSELVTPKASTNEQVATNVAESTTRPSRRGMNRGSGRRGHQVSTGVKNVLAGLNTASVLNKAGTTASFSDPSMKRTVTGAPGANATESVAPALDLQAEPIILIGTEKDANTGARKATEVSSSNVSISG